ncbi:MAG TPA: DUF480 domain-containing protein [Desulfobacteraceae bacterium]|nr:DUF480 domain-containing protein [Desulfobacteraceae bacterium]
MVDFELSASEARVLGCLLEKDMATPEYYPLSLNGLVNACNQKSNRNPVVSYDDNTVLEAVDGLKEKQLVWQSDAGRVPKFSHHFDKRFNLLPRETAVICLLLLRGAQTPGELRCRSERLYPFADLDEVQVAIRSLEEIGLVRKLSRLPGHKESRFAHLLSGEPEQDAAEGQAAAASPGPSGSDRIAVLEKEMEQVRTELADLKQAFTAFREQFD